MGDLHINLAGHGLAEYGGLGLAAVSFVAATLVPISSEAAVIAALRFGMAPSIVLLYASLGNCLGVTLNYLLGRWGSGGLLRRTSQSRSGRRALDWSNRYGRWSLLLSWLPIVGDPLTLVAGAVRVPPLFFVIVAFGVRIVRYLLLVYAFG